MRLRWLMLGVMLVARPVAADCCGDCDGSGVVHVNELVRSVNNALGGCGATATKVLKPRFVQVDGGFTPCVGRNCVIVDYAGAGVLMWLTISATPTGSERIVVTLDDDAPQDIDIFRYELQMWDNDTVNRRAVRLPFGALPFRERLEVSFPEGALPQTLTLYYLAE